MKRYQKIYVKTNKYQENNKFPSKFNPTILQVKIILQIRAIFRDTLFRLLDLAFTVLTVLFSFQVGYLAASITRFSNFQRS